MRSNRWRWQQAVAATGFAVTLGSTGQVMAHEPPETHPQPFVRGSLVQVDVYDRADGAALPAYASDDQKFIVGTPGHEYAVRIRNTTGGRVLVVTSVDGVNVVSGDTAAPTQSGYVLEPWGSVEIAGWRKSMSRTAAFYFTDLKNSYAARTGRPDNVGVIGVAVFQERPKPIAWRAQELRRKLAAAESDNQSGTPSPSPLPAQTPAPAAAGAPAGSRADSARDEPPERLGRVEKSMQADLAAPKLGTGHGRNEESRVTLTRFERATETPADTVAIRYDRRENLIAMGVLPQTAPRIARRDPDPFPGALRFAPDPNR